MTPDCYFVAERQGRLILNMLNEILVFDLSLAIWSIRTNHLRGSSYGYPGVVVSAEAFMTSATERRAAGWTALTQLPL